MYYPCCVLCALWGATSAHAIPTLKTVQESPTAVINAPYTLVFELSWAGDPGEYASVPPTLDLTKWGMVSEITTSTAVEDGQNVIRHAVAILPAEIGAFSIPEVDVPYYSPGDLPEEDENGVTPAYTYPTLQAGILLVNVREPADYMLNTVMILGLGIVLLTCAFVFQRRNAIRIARTTDYSEISIPSIIHDARKHKLDQNYYLFFQGLLRAAGLLKNVAIRKELQKHYEELMLAAGYQGLALSDDDMDAAVAKLEVAYRNDVKTTSPIRNNKQDNVIGV